MEYRNDGISNYEKKPENILFTAGCRPLCYYYDYDKVQHIEHINKIIMPMRILERLSKYEDLTTPFTFEIISDKDKYICSAYEFVIGLDAIYVASQIVTATQGLAAHLDINEAVSVHWTTINGGRLHNLIASEVVLEGSFRFSNESLRESMPKKIDQLVRGICDAFGATYDLDFNVRPMPAVISSSKEVRTMRQALIDGLGEDAVIDMKQPRLAADTMFHWLHRTNGVFYMVGTSDSNPATQYPSHHQKFDISPDTYSTAVAAIALTADRFMNRMESM